MKNVNGKRLLVIQKTSFFFIGDASVLRPTIMGAVPLILDRVYKTITETLKKKGAGFEKIFNFCYDYRYNFMQAIYQKETVFAPIN